MDPIGLSLENFDIVGACGPTTRAIRSMRRGELGDGNEDRRGHHAAAALMAHPDVFVRTIRKKC